MSRRAIGFLIFALLVSAGCVRLGVWQLHRLDQRRALNARLAERLAASPVPVGDLLRDTIAASYRRVTATGTFDFANDMALAARTHEGSPGVNIVTPLKVAGTDTAILVNRGWVYAPDAMTVDFDRWREPSPASITGYLLTIGRGGHGHASTSMHPRVIRRLDLDSLARRLPYPVAPFLLVATGARADANDSTPARLGTPLLDEGPHLGYALQWFAFALIGLVGAGFTVRVDRRGGLRRGTVRPMVRARQ